MKLKKIPERVLNDLRERGHDDEAIAAMTPEKAFCEYCEWNGLIGYGPSLIHALDELRKAAK
jgi:hypothetical protein